MTESPRTETPLVPTEPRDPRCAASFGLPPTSRPDITAAMWWLRDLEADGRRLVSYLRDDELVLTVERAWIRGSWGHLAVTTQRIVHVDSTSGGYAFEIPLLAVLDIANGGEDNGNWILALHDYEAWTKIFVGSRQAIERVNQRVYWRTRDFAEEGQSSRESATDDDVLEEFGRYQALKNARDAGVLDEQAVSAALERLFLPRTE